MGMKIGGNIVLRDFFKTCINHINGDIKSLIEQSFIYNKNKI